MIGTLAADCQEYRYEVGFTLDAMDIVVDGFRARGIGRSFHYDKKSVNK